MRIAGIALVVVGAGFVVWLCLPRSQAPEIWSGPTNTPAPIQTPKNYAAPETPHAPAPDANLLNLSALVDETLTDRELRESLEMSGRPDLAEKSREAERRAARVKELQPSEAALLGMNSTDLAKELAGSPLGMSLIHFSGPDERFAHFASEHRGVSILLSRPDAAESLLKTYQEYSSAIANPPGSTDAEKGRFCFTFARIETLFSQNTVLDQLKTDDQRRALIDAVLVSLDRREQYDVTQKEPLYGQGTHEYAAIPIAKCLERLRDPNFIRWMSSEDKRGLFSLREPTYEETLQILQMGRVACRTTR